MDSTQKACEFTESPKAALRGGGVDKPDTQGMGESLYAIVRQIRRMGYGLDQFAKGQGRLRLANCSQQRLARL